MEAGEGSEPPTNKDTSQPKTSNGWFKRLIRDLNPPDDPIEYARRSLAESKEEGRQEAAKVRKAWDNLKQEYNRLNNKK